MSNSENEPKWFIVIMLVVLALFYGVYITKCSDCESQGKIAVRRLGSVMPICVDLPKDSK
jgi:hypothetical protein